MNKISQYFFLESGETPVFSFSGAVGSYVPVMTTEGVHRPAIWQISLHILSHLHCIALFKSIVLFLYSYDYLQ